MPRYFFNIIDGDDTPDIVGHEFSDLAAAKCQAVRYAGALIGDDAETFWHRHDWQMHVANDNGQTLFTLRLAGFEGDATDGPAPSPRS